MLIYYKMRIFVKIKTGAKKDLVKKINVNEFMVSVKAAPVGGKANHALIRLIAEYLDISAGRIKIIGGTRSRRKTIEII